MHYLKMALLIIALAWPITVLAVLLLSLPQFFSRKALRYRRLLRGESDQDIEPYRPPAWTLRRILVVVLVAPFVAFFVLLFGVPLIIGMTFVALCLSYRNRRPLAYRALRRHHVAFAYIRSHFVGFALFIGTLRRARRPVWSRHV